MNSFLGEDKDFKLYSEFNWEPVQRSQYGGNMVSDVSSSQYIHCCILNNLLTTNYYLLLGDPENKELQLSSLEVINTWTSFSASCWDRMCQILAMLRRWKKEVLEICVKCEIKDSSWSMITPSFLTVLPEAKAMPSRLTIFLDNESIMFLSPARWFQSCQSLTLKSSETFSF